MLSAKILRSPRPLAQETPAHDWDEFSAMLEKLKAENGGAFERAGIGKNLNRLLAWTDEIREGDDLSENAPEDHARRNLIAVKNALDLEAHEYMTLDEESPATIEPDYDIQGFFEAQRKIMDITCDFFREKGETTYGQTNVERCRNRA